MREYVRRCDEAGLDGYFETVRYADTSEPSQERFYGRHGFEFVYEVGSATEAVGITMRRPVKGDEADAADD